VPCFPLARDVLAAPGALRGLFLAPCGSRAVRGQPWDRGHGKGSSQVTPRAAGSPEGRAGARCAAGIPVQPARLVPGAAIGGNAALPKGAASRQSSLNPHSSPSRLAEGPAGLENAPRARPCQQKCCSGALLVSGKAALQRDRGRAGRASPRPRATRDAAARASLQSLELTPSPRTPPQHTRWLWGQLQNHCFECHFWVDPTHFFEIPLEKTRVFCTAGLITQALCYFKLKVTIMSGIQGEFLCFEALCRLSEPRCACSAPAAVKTPGPDSAPAIPSLPCLAPGRGSAQQERRSRQRLWRCGKLAGLGRRRREQRRRNPADAAQPGVALAGCVACAWRGASLGAEFPGS